MQRVLIIGAGGVGNVVTHKCAQVPAVFGDIWLASRTLSKCAQIKAAVQRNVGRTIKTACVDADNVTETIALIKRVKPTLLINVALPYQDLHLMDACLATGTPVPGGLTWYQAQELMRRALAGRRLIGGDVVELAPRAGFHAAAFAAAQLVYDLIGLALSAPAALACR